MRLFCLLTLAVLGLMPAKAATLYSSLGPGGAYSVLRYSIDGASLGFSFQALTPGSVDSITLAIAHFTPPVTVTVSLYAGTSNSLGALLESYALPLTSATASLLTVNSTLHPLLQPSTTYWLTVQDPGPVDSNLAVWNFTGQSGATFFGPVMLNGSLGNSGFTAAFQVDGTATPEPAMAALVQCGLLAMAVAQNRKRA